ncbi:MAG: cupin domain-containing protein [Nitrospirae bacterium]|nr:cupin domain-containing protein [Nitrospirota bacterium]
MPKKEKAPISCDWKMRSTTSRGKKAHIKNKSKLCKHRGNFTWQGIKTEKYKPEAGNWAAIVRRVIIGNYGESAKFHLRYFEIAPGGQSSFEKHRHEHVVVVIRGNGKVFLNKKHHKLSFLDIVYISPNTPHQLLNPFNEPFGFLCAVPAKRDRPIAL